MNIVQNVSDLVNKLEDFLSLRPIETLHEDDGDVLLWRVPICEPPVVGSCLDMDFKEEDYTHWSKIPDVQENPSFAIPVIDDNPRKIKHIEQLDVNTGIDWWDKNRELLNRVIDCFNDWQIKHRFSAHYLEVVKAKIESCRKYGNEHEFSDWQFALLDEMEQWIFKNE